MYMSSQASSVLGFEETQTRDTRDKNSSSTCRALLTARRHPKALHPSKYRILETSQMLDRAFGREAPGLESAFEVFSGSLVFGVMCVQC
jgi:hypothetical protein